MTVTQLFQLYAPLAGLLGLAFWVGVLSQRVRQLETTAKELRDGAHDQNAVIERLVRLEVQMEHSTASLTSVDRSLQGIQRQLGNLMHKGGTVTEFGG